MLDRVAELPGSGAAGLDLDRESGQVNPHQRNMIDRLQSLGHGSGTTRRCHVTDLERDHGRSVIEAVQVADIASWRRLTVKGNAFRPVLVLDDHERALRNVALDCEHGHDLGPIVDGVHYLCRRCHDTSANASIRAAIDFTPEHVADVTIGANADLRNLEASPALGAIGRARSTW
jgi:hypothetical protein